VILHEEYAVIIVVMGQVTSKLLKDTLVEVGLMKGLKYPNHNHFIGANSE
jgi:hypothetical protein